MPQILQGIKVFDLTQNVAGPYCTQLLGDFGAEVVKLERPGSGDDARAWAPPAWGEESTTYLALNRNKRSICVDLDQAAGQEVARRIGSQSDVLIHSLKPGSAEARGLGYEQLAASNPGLVYCAISGFGENGPLKHLPGYDPMIQAYSGIMSVTGHPGEPPLRVGVSIIDMTTGMWSFIGILGALLERTRSGKGARIATSLLETGVAWTTLPMSGYLATGKVPGKVGSSTAMVAPYEAFATADGFVLIATPNDRLFARLCQALGVEHLAADPRFAGNQQRVTNREALHTLIEEHTRAAATGQWIERLRAGGIPCSPIHSIDQVYSDPQVRALEMVRRIEDYRIGDFCIVDVPLRIDGERATLNRMPPRLGEHTDEVLCEYGYQPHEIEALRAAAAIA